jgi:protein-tyrosine phosphatase
VSIIYTHPSGGKLFQVGAQEIPNILKNNDIHLIIYTAKEWQPFKSNPLIDKIFIPLDDTANLTAKEIITTLKLTDTASDAACRYLNAGKNVISSCAAGLNRSGLTSAFTLKKCTNAGRQEIINHIRNTRHPHALSNTLFVKLFLTS